MGRVQKYANVIDDYDKKQEELSKTRSLKNKKLYEEKKEEDDFETTAPISIDELKKMSEEKKEEVPAPDVEPPKVEEPTEDIYITSSFEPVKKPLRIKKTVKFIFTILLLGIIGFLIYFFLLKPAYNYYINSQPINVFYNTIDGVSDFLVSGIDQDIKDNGIFYNDIDFYINTNDDDLKVLSNYTFGYSYGVDVNKKNLEEFIYIKESGNKYGEHYYEKDGKYYSSLSGNDTIFDVTELLDKPNSESVYTDTKELLDALVKYNSSDMVYFIEKNRDIIKSLITKDMITSKRDTIEVNGKSLKVTRNTLTFGKEELENFERDFTKQTLEDKRLFAIFCDLYGVSEEEMKEIATDYDEFDDDEKLIINIYTIKGVEVVGIDIEHNGFTDFYYYRNDKDFEVHLNFTEDEDKCEKGKDCAIQTQDLYDIKGVYNKETNITNVNVKYNKQDFLELNVKQFNKEKIELNYVLYVEKDNKETGNLLLILGDKHFSLDLTCKKDKEYININLNYSYSLDKKIAEIDQSKVEEYTNIKWREAAVDFSKLLDDDGKVEAFDFWLSFREELVKSFSEEYDNVSKNVSV